MELAASIPSHPMVAPSCYGEGTIDKLVRIQSALENEGIQFMDADEWGSIGVRLGQKSKPKK
jgi:hypothetical protein